MERIEREATIVSLTQLESYYQSKYEYYLAMATEAKENKERVGLLLLDLDRDVPSYEDSSIESSLSNGRSHNGSAPHRSLDPERAIQELPQAKPSEPASSVPTGHQIIDEEKEVPSTVEQMKRWTLDLFKAMSVIESVSKNDSGKALHQNYLHHILQRELDIELSSELVELYLEEATRRGYLELDEFDRSCYIALPRNDIITEDVDKPREDDNPTGTRSDRIKARLNQNSSGSRKSYNLPPSNKLKSTLLETIEGYIAQRSPKRFTIEDVIDYLYSSTEQLDWSQPKKNKVRGCISNVLGRKAYLGKHWSRIKPGVYRPLT